MSGFRGDFLWYDLMTTDVEAAKAFYSEVVGWSVQAWDGGEKPYQMWMAGEGAIGGVVDLPQEARDAGAPPHWLAYVGSPDVDATAKQVGELGGEVLLPPMGIPSVGRICVFRDPQGAVIAAFTPEGDPPPALPPGTAGRFSWNELMSTDADAGWKFYEAIAGWQKTDSMDMGPEGVYQMYGKGDRTFGGIMTKPAQLPVSAWLHYVTVADLEGSLGRVASMGGTVVNGPMEVPGGDRVAQCSDPQGAMFAMHWVKAS